MSNHSSNHETAEAQSVSGSLDASHSTQSDLVNIANTTGDLQSEKAGNILQFSEDERAILRRQIHVPNTKVNFITLFRYASKLDIAILAISSLCSIIAGAVLPLMNVLVGSLSQSFGGFYHGGSDVESFKSSVSKFALYFIYIAVAELVAEYVATVGFMYVGEHITAQIRERYLAAVLRQNIAFFDNLGAGAVTAHITANTNQIQDGISQKLGLTLTAIATFVAAFVIAFAEYWKLALIMSSAIVAIVLEMSFNSWLAVRYARSTSEAYAEGATVAEEVLSSIRNVVAFSTEEKLAKKYDTYLDRASKFDLKQKVVVSISLALLISAVYLSTGLCFWLGSRYIVSGETSLNAIVTISFSTIMGAFALGNIGPYVQAFSTAVASASTLFSTIDRMSPLDPADNTGVKLDGHEFKGDIELKSVKHVYPSRPDVVAMHDVSLKIPSGSTTALVGASGSGKSTIVGLVERFYDPIAGQILLDGRDIKDYNLRWLRREMSLVQQEPTLFSASIYENIRLGLVGTQHENAVGEQQTRLIEEAASQANAHEFISSLPDGYQTNIGAGGFLLSGGQKQRVAIARAIVSNPRILLLDEATSALDTKSEGVVQAALEKASQGRTTIVIAHRLSTIENADNIVVMSEGRVLEQGTHSSLLAAQGAYHGFFMAQQILEQKAEQPEPHSPPEDTEDYLTPKEKLIQPEASSTDSEGDRHGNEIEKVGLSDTSPKTPAAIDSGNGSDYSAWRLLSLILSFNRKETLVMLNGLFWSVIAGGANPTQSVFFAFIINYLSIPFPYTGLRDNINFWCWMYFMLALVALLSNAAYGWSFALCSQRLNQRVRSSAFRTMLRQDVGFFDRDENSAGRLTSFLSTGATTLSGLSGTTMGTILMTITNLVASIIIGIVFAWRLALVCTACIPIVFVTGVLRFRLLATFEVHASKAYEASASDACEATSAIHTVASLTLEDHICQRYHNALVAQQKSSTRSILKSAILYATSQSVMFLIMALAFWYGGTLLVEGTINVFDFFVAFSACVFGSQSASLIFTFAPDMGKAKHAAFSLQKLYNSKSLVDTQSTTGKNISAVQGRIEMRNVHFRYPTRLEQPVLQGLDLVVEPGQFVALVGPSGCGKSTTIALTERFYDPSHGEVLLDGQRICDLNVSSYRKHLGLVSQEPTLYHGTIRENLLLGSVEDDDKISEEAIAQACKEANIYDFIKSLPNGFSTSLGSKGCMLSGGQKQRIAIARALLRNPRILLLDEATSALDSESEKVVQAALDKAAKGRTTIAVAHRLSSIQRADVIYVFEQGRIVEKGRHDDLLRLNGRYAELVRLQNVDKR